MRIRDQIEKVEEMTGDMDPKTNFSLILIQTELERWKYLVRGFLRARIAKVYFFDFSVTLFLLLYAGNSLLMSIYLDR